MLLLGMIENTVDNLPGRENWSKLYHLVFYAGLASMLWFGLLKSGIVRVTLLVMLAGMIDEIHQYFLPFRHGRLSDVLLDTVAALLAVLLLAWLRGRLQDGSNDSSSVKATQPK